MFWNLPPKGSLLRSTCVAKGNLPLGPCFWGSEGTSGRSTRHPLRLKLSPRCSHVSGKSEINLNGTKRKAPRLLAPVRDKPFWRFPPWLCRSGSPVISGPPKPRNCPKLLGQRRNEDTKASLSTGFDLDLHVSSLTRPWWKDALLRLRSAFWMIRLSLARWALSGDTEMESARLTCRTKRLMSPAVRVPCLGAWVPLHLGLTLSKGIPPIHRHWAWASSPVPPRHQLCLARLWSHWLPFVATCGLAVFIFSLSILPWKVIPSICLGLRPSRRGFHLPAFIFSTQSFTASVISWSKYPGLEKLWMKIDVGSRVAFRGFCWAKLWPSWTWASALNRTQGNRFTGSWAPQSRKSPIPALS